MLILCSAAVLFISKRNGGADGVRSVARHSILTTGKNQSEFAREVTGALIGGGKYAWTEFGAKDSNSSGVQSTHGVTEDGEEGDVFCPVS